MPPGRNQDAYREVWLADFEFSASPGERPVPVCLVAREFWSGRTIWLWQDDLRGCAVPPYPIGGDVLFVAYYASTELGCHLALEWPMPERVLDLYVEFRCLTNGLDPYCGNGLLGALAWNGLDAMGGAEKESMRKLVTRGGPGRSLSGGPCSLTVRPTFWRWRSCSPRCCRGWISPGPFSGAGTCGPWP